MTENSQTQPAQSDWLQRILWAAIVGGAVYAYMNWDTVAVSLLGPSAYTCKNMVPEVVATAEKNGGILNMRLIGIIDQSQVSKTKTRLECKGQGVFSTGAKLPIAYRAYEESEQWWIFYEVQP